MQLDTVCNRFERRVIDLYAAEPDLHTLPREVFECVDAAAANDMVAYAEFHLDSGEFRAEFSRIDPDPERRARIGRPHVARHLPVGILHTAKPGQPSHPW